MRTFLFVLFSIILSILLPIMLSSCNASPMSFEALKSYAFKNFGEGEIIQESEKEDFRSIVVKDKEFGFEYHVESNVVDITVDLTKFGESESTSSNFANEYIDFIINIAKTKIPEIENSDLWEFNYRSIQGINSIAEFVLYGESDFDEAFECAESLGRVFQEYDSRKFFENRTIIIKEQDGVSNDRVVIGETLASYHIHKNNWTYKLTEEEKKAAEIDFIKDYVKTYLTKEAVFVRSEEIPFGETGLSLHQIMNTFDENQIESADDLVTLYYFDLNGKEYFVASFFLDGKQCNGFTTVRYNNFPEEYQFWN